MAPLAPLGGGQGDLFAGVGIASAPAANPFAGDFASGATLPPRKPAAANPYQAPSAHSGGFSAFGEAALRSVATGLNLIYWGVATVLLSAILGSVGIGVFTAGQQLAMLGAVALLMVLGVLAGGIMMLVGRIYCLSVPDETGAKSFIVIAVICDILGMGLGFVGGFSDSAPASGLGNLTNLLASVMFILFMKKVADFVGRKDLAERSMSLLILGGVMFGLMVLMFALVVVTAASGASAAALGMVMLVLGLSLFVVGIFMFFRYVRLLVDLRTAILTGR